MLEMSYAGVVEKYHIYNPPVKYAIVKHRPRSGGLSYFPDTIPMQNIPMSTGKGDPIHIESNWWHHMERINSERGYKWARSIGNMWINLEYAIEVPYSTARAESIYCGGNYISFDEETATHVKLVAYDYRMDTAGLNTNWFNTPYMYWKGCAVNAEGKVIKVANALDVYFPLISERDLWMNKNDLEIFPDGYDYNFANGRDVYDGNRPLYAGGHFTTDWHFHTISVP